VQRQGAGGYGAGVDGRTLLLGDWTPVVRDGIDVLRLAIFAGAAGYAASGQWGSAALLVALGSITLVARLVNLPRLYDLSLTLGMALQGFGETLGLYDEFVRFDDLVHFTLRCSRPRSSTSASPGWTSSRTPATRRTCGTTWASAW
jgi:hypothetical protein